MVGAEAVFPGGVDVASDVEPVLGDVVAGEAAGDLLLGFQGADASPGDRYLSGIRRRIRLGCACTFRETGSYRLPACSGVYKCDVRL